MPRSFLGKAISPAAAAMPWLGQQCALHARLAEGLLLQGAAARSLALGSSSSSSSSPGEAGSRGAGGLLLGDPIQPCLGAGKSHHQPARLWQGPSSTQRWHQCLSRTSLVVVPRAMRTASIRCGQDELLPLLLRLPFQQPEGEVAGGAQQLLSKITRSGLGAGGGGGGGGSSSSARTQKDAGGYPEKEPADPSKENGKKPNKSQQLKKVFKEYGAVGVVFHVGISLMSLGMFYLAVSSGVDIAAILFKLGFDEAVVQSKLAAGTSTFVLAYAIHKLFAPVRISITLVSVPLLVRYFRKIGFFKPPAPNP